MYRDWSHPRENKVKKWQQKNVKKWKRTKDIRDVDIRFLRILFIQEYFYHLHDDVISNLLMCCGRTNCEQMYKQELFHFNNNNQNDFFYIKKYLFINKVSSSGTLYSISCYIWSDYMTVVPLTKFTLSCHLCQLDCGNLGSLAHNFLQFFSFLLPHKTIDLKALVDPITLNLYK